MYRKELTRSRQELFKRLLMPMAIFVFLVAPLWGQDAALKRLNESPRHHEWVAIQHGERVVHSFLVFPEVKDKVPVVIVIHENRGLTDWVRSVADQLAEQGYIAIAPDLLSGMGPDGGKTSDFPDMDAARNAIYELPARQVTADLNAVFDYAAKLPAANGTVSVAGFCWGGTQTFQFACEQPKLAAAFVFYGSPPESKDQVAKINCPVYGFYGGNDARVSASIPVITELMKEAGKKYQPVVYDNAGHGFMRLGEAADASEANKAARDKAWQRWLELLKS
jgi:carboxymethylenebutenolidase